MTAEVAKRRLWLLLLEFNETVGLLTKPKRTMKSKVKDTVHYLQLVDCTLDVANQNEES